MMFLAASSNVFADKEILYSDKNITIYTDNTMTYTGKKTVPVFKPSNSWVEEDYFTQQEKYCEVDSIYSSKLKQSLVENR
ncbi:hypothetical protein N9345_02315 [Candidatus Thioglobus sp.]|nr:hypothetical protein [Candidatus Thioglobus sp.]MDB3869404.1 hypothetical protein [Candidatus Thioglobus sp.]MDB3893005.1 hypothetical protein [Candidatus Thioglobus sp.]MDC0920332.1 hypothetical protein [Candidatus Thioglobus sp.]